MNWICPKCRHIQTALPPMQGKNLYCHRWSSIQGHCDGLLFRYDQIGKMLAEGGVFFFCTDGLINSLPAFKRRHML